MNDYTPQPVPSVTTPELRHWLDTEHRRIAQTVAGLRNAITALGPSLSGFWRFDSATAAADPGQGELRFNNATPASVTAVYINEVSEPGTDAERLFGLLSTGDELLIQQQNDSSRFIRVSVSSAATDNGAWFTIPVTVLDSGSLPANGEELNVILLGGAASGFNTALDYTVSGDWVFNAAGTFFDSSIIISGASIAGFTLIDEDAASDEKATHFRLNSGVLSVYNTTDATPTSVSGASRFIAIDRAGLVPGSFQLDGSYMSFGDIEDLSATTPISTSNKAFFVFGTDNSDYCASGVMVIEGTNNPRCWLFADEANNNVGVDFTYSSGVPGFDIRRVGTACARFGSSAANPFSVTAADATGDCWIGFYESGAFSTRKGYLGFGNVGDDTMHIVSEESGADLSLMTTTNGEINLMTNGTTRFRVNGASGNTEIPLDSFSMFWGASQDLGISHNGTNSVINNVTGSVLCQFNGSTRITWNTTGVSFWGQTPAARPDYTVTNAVTDRAISANGTGETVATLSSIVGTLITDLIAIGLLQ